MGTQTVLTCDDCGKSGSAEGGGAREFYSFGISINPYPMLNTWNHWRGSCLLCLACAQKHPVFAGAMERKQNYGDGPQVVRASLEKTAPYALTFRETDYI